MDAKTRRKHLRDYSAAHRDIELTGAAITILEKVSGAQRVIAALQKMQGKQLAAVDAAAARLGAHLRRLKGGDDALHRTMLARYAVGR